MEVDLMVDFLFNKSVESPMYFISERDVPDSISGGWVEMSIPYFKYKTLTSKRQNLDFMSDV